MTRRLLLLSTLLLSLACSGGEDPLIAKSRRVFGTIPQAQAQDAPQLVALGRALYFSPNLSLNRTQSCNSCHPVDGGGVGSDNLPVSPGATGAPGRRNTPTVLNAAFHQTQFWDGRAATLEEQAKGPILNPIEMAMPDERAVEGRLHAGEIVDLALFDAAFPGGKPYTLDHVATAIAAFERSLRTRDRFDDFLEGDADALTAAEKKGLETFLANGCASCHNGAMLGGDKFMKIGVVNPYDNPKDRGRFEVTMKDSDQYVFKVPSLRNVALTPPYFHDGAAPDLHQAVDRMAWYQLGAKLPPEERDSIVTFLRALSDVERSR